MNQEVFYALIRLAAAVAGGFFFFRLIPSGEKLLEICITAAMNLFLPIYFIYNFIDGWSSAVSAGRFFIPVFFFGSMLFLLVQLLLSRLLSRPFVREQKHQKDFILLFTFHNAGYIALPIMEAFAPKEILVFMFFWIFAFNLLFWTLSMPLLGDATQRRGFQLNGPLCGILIGFTLCLLGADDFLQSYTERFLAIPASLGIQLILVCLGGILSRIPREQMHLRSDYLWFILFKLLLFPLSLILLLSLLPGGNSASTELIYALKLSLVLQAAVPPSTNLMIACKRYGSKEQLAYIAGGESIIYPASALSIPLVLFLANALLS